LFLRYPQITFLHAALMTFYGRMEGDHSSFVRTLSSEPRPNCCIQECIRFKATLKFRGPFAKTWGPKLPMFLWFYDVKREYLRNVTSYRQGET